MSLDTFSVRAVGMRGPGLTEADRAEFDAATDEAAVFAAEAEASAIAALAAETGAAAYEAATAAAAGVTLPNQPTKAALDAAIGSYTNGNNIFVSADETHFGEASIYTKTAGVAVYSHAAGISPQFDPLSRAQIPPRLTGPRTTGLHIRKAFDDVRAGTRLYLTGLAVGDSLSLLDYPSGAYQFATIAAGHFKDSPVLFADYLASYLYPVPGSGQPVSAKFTCTNNIKVTAEYSKVWTGSDQTYTADAQYCCYSGDSGGSGRACDYMRIFMLTDVGSGVFKVEIANSALCPAVGSGSWVSPVVGQIASAHSLTGSDLLIDTNSAAGMAIVELALAYGQWHLKLTKVSGGNGRSIVPNFEVHTKPAINIYRLAVGSNDFFSETTAANAYMAALIANLKPDFVNIGSADPLVSYQNFLPKFETALTAAALTFNPFVMVETNAYSTDEADLGARANYVASYCASRMGRAAPDLLAIAGGAAEATREGVAGDSVHPYVTNPIAWQAAWRAWLNSMNLIARPFKGSASLNDAARGLPGRLLDTSNIIGVRLSRSDFDTSAMAWSKISSSSSGTTAVKGADNALTLTTTATANDKVTAYIDDPKPIYGSAGGARSITLAGGMGFRIMPLVANVTGVLRLIWSNRAYDAAHGGALTAYGLGVILENLTLTLIGWNNVTEARGGASFTTALDRGDDVMITWDAPVANSNFTTLECRVNGVLIATASVLNNGTIGPVRVEMTNGSTAAVYSVKITPPILYTVRG